MKCLLDATPPHGSTVEILDRWWQEFQEGVRAMYGDRAHEILDWFTCRPVYEKMRSKLLEQTP